MSRKGVGLTQISRLIEERNHTARHLRRKQEKLLKQQLTKQLQQVEKSK